MSNDILKADQIAFHFYTKLFYIVNDARDTEGTQVPQKVDKWVCIYVPVIVCAVGAHFGTPSSISRLSTRTSLPRKQGNPIEISLRHLQRGLPRFRSRSYCPSQSRQTIRFWSVCLLTHPESESSQLRNSSFLKLGHSNALLTVRGTTSPSATAIWILHYQSYTSMALSSSAACIACFAFCPYGSSTSVCGDGNLVGIDTGTSL